MSETASQLTAPKLHVEAANGVTYTYRRFGNRSTGALPLVCFIHYRGNLDNWDPILVDTLATSARSCWSTMPAWVAPRGPCLVPWPRWRGMRSRSSAPWA